MSATDKTTKPAFMQWWLAGYAAGIERGARVAEGGSFLHDDAPVAKWARELAEAIRREAP